jgi:uncharacterized membrane protein
MEFITNIKLFFISIITLIIIDYIWFGIIYLEPYRKIIESVQKTKLNIRLSGGLIVYIALALIIVFWIIPRIVLESKNNSNRNLLLTSFIYGGILGGLMYAFFDFTSYTIFSNWDLKTSIVDTIWGTVLMTIVSFITAYSNKYLL